MILQVRNLSKTQRYRGYDEIEVDYDPKEVFTTSDMLRTAYINGKLCYLTRKSYKELKKRGKK